MNRLSVPPSSWKSQGDSRGGVSLGYLIGLIVEAHPDWSISRCTREAGKVLRDSQEARARAHIYRVNPGVSDAPFRHAKDPTGARIVHAEEMAGVVVSD